MSNGFIVQIIGAVVDIEFPQNAVPQVYDALKVVSEGQGQGLVLEVQQQIGGGVVRCITMGSSDGLRRGLEVVNSGKAIQVPVGTSTLGRIMNVLGDPIDEKGPIGEEERWSIHREAPSYEDQSNSTELLETGIKVFIRDTATDQAETNADGPLTDRVVYYLEAVDVPLDVLKEALAACNSNGSKGASAYNATFENGRCAIRTDATRGLLDAANPSSAAKGKIGLMFDETI
jgi:hypothetical protein